MGTFENIFGRTQHSKCNGCGKVFERGIKAPDNKNGKYMSRNSTLSIGTHAKYSAPPIFCSPECEATQQKKEAEEPHDSQVFDGYLNRAGLGHLSTRLKTLKRNRQ